MALELTYEPVERPISGVSGTAAGGTAFSVGIAASRVVLTTSRSFPREPYASVLSAADARVLAKALNALADKIDGGEIPF